MLTMLMSASGNAASASSATSAAAEANVPRVAAAATANAGAVEAAHAADDAAVTAKAVDAAEAVMVADVFAPAQVKAGFVKGADISTLYEMEVAGFKYYGLDGQEGDALTLLKQQGFNYVRLRLWNDPYDASGKGYGGGTNDVPTNLALAKRAKALGMGFLLDFHYSDFWADPSKQFKPKAWEGMSFDELKKAVYQYTYDTIKIFKDAGVLPDMVQVGNEITYGMLWPEGKLGALGSSDFARLAALLKAGIAGVKDAAAAGGGAAADDAVANTATTAATTEASKVKIMLHIDKGTRTEQAKWWFSEVTKQGVPFDVVGLSMYPWWEGKIPDLVKTIKWLGETYHKEVYVVEASYGYGLEDPDHSGNLFTQESADKVGYPATVAGQATYLKELMEAVAAVDCGQGIFYWEPAWKAHHGISWASKAGMQYMHGDPNWQEGNAWENQALFDDQGKLLNSVKVFNAPATSR